MLDNVCVSMSSAAVNLQRLQSETDGAPKPNVMWFRHAARLRPSVLNFDVVAVMLASYQRMP